VVVLAKGVNLVLYVNLVTVTSISLV
jgi:hypothetical protein